MQRLELAPTLVPLPRESVAEDADEAEAEPMPQRPVVLAGFPLSPGAPGEYGQVCERDVKLGLGLDPKLRQGISGMAATQCLVGGSVL